jgi:hypothetical protein
MEADRKRRDYSAKVAEAEEAVQSVKDAELRRVAFEKILTHLLSENTPASSAPTDGSSAAKSSNKVSPKGKLSPRASKAGPIGRITELADEDFFSQQRTIADVKTELANRGHHIPLTSLSGPLQALTQKRRLRRQKIPANGKGSKTTYAYSNW